MQPPHRATAQRLWLDVALVLLLAAATLSDSLHAFGSPDDKMVVTFGSVDAVRIHLVWWWLAGVPAAVAIVLRHRWPLAAMFMAAGSTGIHLLDPIIKAPPMDLAVLFTMYTLAGSTHARRTVVTVLISAEALLFAGCLAKVIRVEGGSGDTLALLLSASKSAAVPGLLLAATWAVADSARTRRAHLATLQARAEDLKREQQQRTALAIATERGRITRELHDVVAHGLSVMVVQALGAKAMLSRQPERTEAALTNIVTTGRASLAEMRRLLGVVRIEQRAELAPQPTLAALPELVDRVRDTGTPVDIRVTGEPATLPAVIELAAYRIVQEALTNTIKHATPGAGCTVALDYSPDGLRITVADSGKPVPPPSPGNGLRGITERVHALGGELRAGPTPSGGFEVSARLPMALVDASPEPVG